MKEGVGKGEGKGEGEGESEREVGWVIICSGQGNKLSFLTCVNRAQEESRVFAGYVVHPQLAYTLQRVKVKLTKQVQTLFHSPF